jgi:two-component system CitB family sensor kinase
VTNGEGPAPALDRGTALGEPVAKLIPDGRLRDLLTGKSPAPTRWPAMWTPAGGQPHARLPVGSSIGSVVTLQDRTEIEAPVREMP